MYLALLDALQIGADEAIALEDAAHGVAAAKSAGLFCVAVPNRITQHVRNDAADLHIESLEYVSVAYLSQAFTEVRQS